MFTSLIFRWHDAFVDTLRQAEKSWEDFLEVEEEVVGIDLVLTVVWQLTHHIAIVTGDRLVPIFLPLVIKEVFYLVLELRVERLPSIEAYKHLEELGELISFVQVFIKSLNLVQNIDEVSQNIWEYRHSK